MSYDEITVCAVHLRFVPCRHGNNDSPCEYSSKRNDIVATYVYQQGGEKAEKWLSYNIDTTEYKEGWT